MQRLMVISFIIFSGCALNDYPGGAKDIERWNQETRERREYLAEQARLTDIQYDKRKAERDELERKAVDDYKQKLEEKKKIEEKQKEESRKQLETFVNVTSEEVAIEKEQNEAALNLGQRNTRAIETYIKSKLNHDRIKVRCRYQGNGSATDEVQCAVITSNTDRRSLHDLQSTAYSLAIDLRRVYPSSYSIFAQTVDDIPLARFMYNYPLDIFTPLIMWH